jgi:type I restriction enzyme M protein
MTSETHTQLANFIWSICNLLRGVYKRNEYRKVILPLTVLRRFDCLLEPTKAAVLKVYEANKERPESVQTKLLTNASKYSFYNLSKLDFPRLLDDPSKLAESLVVYLGAFSPNVRTIMERFKFEAEIAKMAEKDRLFNVIKAFCGPRIDLSAEHVDNLQMGYVFEELIRIGAEQSNEEAGEHFTPREVIKLMVNLLLSPEGDLGRSHVVKTIYDPACGTGGMLSVAEGFIRSLNTAAHPMLFGQDVNDEAWAVCTSDMLIKGESTDNIRLGDTFTEDRFQLQDDGRKWTFDYMLANPPFGVEWKNQQKVIEHERDDLGFAGRFGAGTPRINDGALLFLQHMLSKMRTPADGGSRIGIVFNGSPLFTGDAGSGESSIRQWILENDWLEAIVALPDQLFYNTGISTYIWVLTNRKEKRRKGKVQLVDARRFFIKMKKSLGNKRNKIGEGVDNEPDHIGDIARIHGDFQDGQTHTFANGVLKSLVVSKVFDNEDFGFRKITVERPLRLGFPVTLESIARLDQEKTFLALASSSKKKEADRQAEIEAGRKRQEVLRSVLRSMLEAHEAECAKDGENDHGEYYFMGREEFHKALDEAARGMGHRLSAPEKKAAVAALGERNEAAEICRNRDDSPEPDPELRDTENVPLKEDVEEYFKREVLPHVPDAWIDHGKTKIGYEIPFNRHFYRYEPPRELADIEADIKGLEEEIMTLLREVTA